MHIITRSRLTDFARRHPDATSPLREWVRVMRRKQYRLVVDLRYELGRVYIRHIVTHDVYLRLIKRDAL